MQTSLSLAVDWRALGFDALTVHQLYALLRLRSEIFVVEQRCAYLDPDGKDLHPQALHLLGYDGDTLAASARILPPGLGYDGPSIGRVVVAATHRGTGLGHGLMREALNQLFLRWPGSEVQLGAQAHLADFYAAHGFSVASPVYDEDGIPHVTMRRPA
ncbi:GNAT family N-acetyltransferase [Hylemonella sp. W303a]|uniref:GNAT family N-acetyltransferase n=1 Tax=Hylemonella sp. W303a TaxID=3389873 RepID=UPI00396AF6CC